MTAGWSDTGCLHTHTGFGWVPLQTTLAAGPFSAATPRYSSTLLFFKGLFNLKARILVNLDAKQESVSSFLPLINPSLLSFSLSFFLFFRLTIGLVEYALS